MTKFFLRIVVVLSVTSSAISFANAQDAACRENLDKLFDRNDVLQTMKSALSGVRQVNGRGFDIRNSRPFGFHVYDLTDSSVKTIGSGRKRCLEFTDGHVYHFSPFLLEESQSFIAVLHKGETKIFPRINCGDRAAKLEEVKVYIRKSLNGTPKLDETLIRLSFYRRYAWWGFKVEPLHFCEPAHKIPDNRYGETSRYSIIQNWSAIAINYLPEGFEEYWGELTVDNEVAPIIYIRDLNDLSNKQTSVVEPVMMYEGHVYQFGLIDLPFSLTHFAVLKDGKVRVFEALECGSKEDNLSRLFEFIDKNFSNAKKRKILKKRIRDNEKFRVAVPFEGSSEPRWVCPVAEAEMDNLPLSSSQR